MRSFLETETFSESVVFITMEREVQSNFREFQVSEIFVDSFFFFFMVLFSFLSVVL